MSTQTTTTINALPALSIESAPEYSEVTATETQEILINTRICGCASAQGDEKDRAPLSVTAVVDRSGSMSGQKLNMVKKTLDFVTRQLQSQDKLGIVTYDDCVQEVLKPTTMDANGRDTATTTISNIVPGGCTNLSGGLYRGLEQQLALTGKSTTTTTPTAPPPPTAPSASCGSTSVDLQIGNMYMAGSDRWTVFVQSGNGQPLAQVKQVTFTVLSKGEDGNTTEQHAPVSVFSAPFQLEQEGKATNVKIEVELAEQFNNGKTLEFEHTLGFDSCLNAKMHTVSLTDTTVPTAPTPTAPTTTSTTTSSQKATIHSVWLFTDGLANAGDTQLPIIMDKVRAFIDSTTTPVLVNTFGYGSSHNVDLLRNIAEVGNGMYYFVEDPAQIGQCFVECLGGLLSVVAQNVDIKLFGLPGAEVTKVFTHFPCEKFTEDNKTGWKVKICDIFAEEHKDLLCRVKVNSLPTVPEGDTGVVQCDVKYNNALTASEDTATGSCSILRPEKAIPFDEQSVPDVVDQQRNRVKTAEAFEKARQEADKGNLQNARDMMMNMKKAVQVSKSAGTSYCADMMEDIDDVMECFGSSSHYAAVGHKVAAQTEGVWRSERGACVKGKDRFINEKQKQLKSACPRR